jgi:trk system potassium uptake protein TrkH
MNFRLLAKLLGILVLLIGGFMLLCLIWAWPQFGAHTHPDPEISEKRFEAAGAWGLLLSAAMCGGLGGAMLLWGRGAKEKIFRKEAMAAVALSWVLATVLGALPYVFSGSMRGPSVRDSAKPDQVLVASSRFKVWNAWNAFDVTVEQKQVLAAVANSTARGISKKKLQRVSGVPAAAAVFRGLQEDPRFAKWLLGPGDVNDAPQDRASRFRLRWVSMGLVDGMFEAQSGFSTTGATVFCDLEDPHLVPHCILFWRSMTHFLGGLGIIVLFVVLLGQNSAGKALMRTEMPGPTQDSSSARMQHSAWLFAGVYIGLNVLLALVLIVLGMSAFDAVCHSFGTMATGGFSTYNSSLGHFYLNNPSTGRIIEYVVILFMVCAGANFTLLFLAVIGKPLKLFRDTEFRSYIAIIVVSTSVFMLFGFGSGIAEFQNIESGIRNSLFQIVSVLTTTGFGTANFDTWHDMHRGWLLAIMFVGGCTGSTGGGMKVIRHILFVKILRLEVESAFNPHEVRLLKLDGKSVEDQGLRHSVLVYFGLVVVLFVLSFVFVVGVEPNSTWGGETENKLIDSASAVSATLNNIGPGLGVVGPTQNYASFSGLSKSLFILLMMLGRLEVFPILVLFSPRFWDD